ncbi:MAG TPA: hypothetical protein VFM68_03020 [Candidatus Saccharimonadales bacterium]|nr:hypothetical protein [Candidatus Saccharimonadales bacterium]
MFSDHDPIYIYIDNLGGWNVDTRYITADLRQWIEAHFESLFDRQFPVLTVPDVLNAHSEFFSMFLLHVTLTKNPRNPTVVLTYYDMHETYPIRGHLTQGVPTTCDAILDDFRGGAPS